MKESRWEITRQKERKKILLLSLIALPVIAIAIILIVNNRELIGPSNSSGSPQIKQIPIKKTPPQKDTTIVSPMIAAVSKKDLSPPPTPVIKDHEPVRQQKKPLSLKDTVAVPEVINQPDETKTITRDSLKCCSVDLPSFPCRIESRKDIVIYLSLELFFSDADKRSAILLRREDIKVMVMRTIRSKELTEMKIGELETQFLHSINSIFDRTVISTVKIKNIQVEKAAQ